MQQKTEAARAEAARILAGHAEVSYCSGSKPCCGCFEAGTGCSDAGDCAVDVVMQAQDVVAANCAVGALMQALDVVAENCAVGALMQALDSLMQGTVL